MPHAVRVHGFESLCDLCGKTNQPTRFERTFLQQDPHGFASYKFHGDKEPALVLAHLIDCCDARMVQGRRNAGFRENHLSLLMVPSVFFGKEFQRDGPPELQVFRAVDHSHSPATELCFHYVMCDFRAKHHSIRQALGKLPAWYDRHPATSMLVGCNKFSFKSAVRTSCSPCNQSKKPKHKGFGSSTRSPF